MATNKIKGLTVEIGGDTTKLGKALEDVNKKSTDLSGELRDINKLLKLDPGNMDALAQKQQVLAEAIENTEKKLDTLKEAERQVQEQFERGEVSEEQVRALQREIISTTAALKKHKQQAAATASDIAKYGADADNAADDTEELGDEASGAKKDLDKLADSADDAGEAGEGMGTKFANVAKVGLSAVVAGATAVITGMVGAAEETREYRREMGKLETAFTTQGFSAEAATSAYQDLQGVLGETDQAVEAASHLAQLTDNEEDLAKWTGDILPGVFATFGASLPIEGLTEAANETAKVGQVTGPLADALNWAGVSEDAFNESLAACTTEQERQALITETLSGLYGDAAKAYKETNAEVIRANEANELWTASLAEVGGAVEPVLTDVKMLGASLLTDFLPGVKGVAEAVSGLLNGEDGAAANLGAALSGMATQLLDKVVELAPTIVSVGMSLITTLVTTLISMLPQLLETGVTLIVTVLEGITTAIPDIVAAIVDMIPLLVDALVSGLPLLLQGAIDLLMALVNAVPLIIPPLVAALPTIILALVDALTSAIPQLLQGAIQLFRALVQAVPILIKELLPQIPKIISSVINAILSLRAELMTAAVTVFMEIVKAIPTIVKSLIKVLPQVWKAIKNALSGIPSKIMGIFNQVLSSIGTWAVNLAKKGASAAKDLFNSIVNGIKKLPTKMASIGKDLVKGLWNGIKDMVGWIGKKVKGFGDSVLSGLKDFFGIHSPSKETEWMGKMLDEGLANGITKNADLPLESMDDLATDMLDQDLIPNGISLERNIAATYSPAQEVGTNNLMSKLDRILEAIERGQIIALDGDTLIGGTLDRIESGLGRRYILASKGVI